MRYWLAILLAAGVSACAVSADDPRYQFGVSADQSAPGQPQTAAILEWKAQQICTQGYRVVKQDTMNTETGGQIVDNHLQCNAYRPSLDPGGLDWPTLF